MPEAAVRRLDVESVNSSHSISSSVRQRILSRARKVKDRTHRLRHKILGSYNVEYSKWALGTVFLLASCVGAIYVYETSQLTVFINWVEDAPLWASTLAFTGLYFFVSLPIGWGYIILNLAAGYLYGLWVGQLVTVVAATTGTVLATLTCRYFLHDWVHSKVEGYPTMNALLRVVNGPNVVRVIIMSRLSPFPYGLQNAVFSLSSVSMPCYTVASLLGCFPTQLLNTYMGTTLKSIQDVLAGGGEMDVTTYAVFAGQLIIGVLLLAMVLYATKIEFHSMVGEQAIASMELSSGSEGEDVDISDDEDGIVERNVEYLNHLDETGFDRESLGSMEELRIRA
eukprot:CFRG4776T1